ncbi:hypothetical protein DEU34_1541 [Microbacterium sp. AG1240]|uniref:dioxygenase n=1 Tax=Microbacterium sp. AG1240 TaxID=2183992 RepID=UPI000EACDB9A|nr:dioxygenase [Microbacterium sp. AG1240]RKT37003.1 hypothetical protein DEU34_1541 [Microbacterium sp. AG1240]
MATGGKDRSAKAARERARIYQARQELHTAQKRRRTRDNLIAGIAGAVIVLAAIGAQVAYFTAGPGAPEPAASSEPTPSTSTAPGTGSTSTPAPDATEPAATPTP